MRAYLRGLLENDKVRLTGAVLLLCAVVYQQFLFGNDFFIWPDAGSDTLNSYWPAYTHFSNSFKQGFEFFSLELGLGINLFSGSMLFFDPFIWLYAFFDYLGIARLLILVYILKILIGTLFFHRFIGYYVQNRPIIFVTALLYGFSGFSVVWGQHYFFGTLVMVFPMILLGIESALHRDRYGLLIFSTALGMTSAYYFMYMSAFFLAVFLLARMLFLYKGNYRQIFTKGVKIGGAFVLGIGISAVVLLPTVAATLTTSRVSGQMTGIPLLSIINRKTLLTMAGSFFSNSLLGTASTFAGVENYYDSPHLYCGLLVLLALPQIWVSRSRAEKGFVAALVGFSAISLIFPYAAVAFNGFSMFSYRWTYFVIVFLLISAALAFQAVVDRQEANGPILKLTLLGLVFGALLVSLGYYVIRSTRDFGGVQVSTSLLMDTFLRVGPVVVLLGAYFVLFQRLQWRYSALLFAVLLAGEIIWNTGATIWGRKPVSTDYVVEKTSYFDDSFDAARNISAMDSELYRVDKSFYSQFLNDGLMQGYRNIHGYWSIIPGTTLNFFDAVGGATALNLQLGFIESDVIRSLLGVKYYMVRSLDEAPEGYELVGQWGDVIALKNNHWVPMGSVYQSFITKSNIQNFSTQDRDIVIAKACVIPDEHVGEARAMGMQEVLSYADFADGWSDPAAYDDLAALSSNPVRITVGRDDYIEGSLNSPTAGIVFFSINADEGWSVYIDDEKKTIIDANWGMIGVFVEPGEQQITLRYTPPMLREGAAISAVSALAVLVLFVVSRGWVGKRLLEKFRI